MRENPKARIFTQAIDLLVEQAVAAKRPDSPGAYAATVRADLSDRLRDKAREVFAENPHVTPSELAAILSEHEKRPALTLVEEPPSPTAALPTFTAIEWVPASPEEREHARRRLAEIKAGLKKEAGAPAGEHTKIGAQQ